MTIRRTRSLLWLKTTALLLMACGAVLLHWVVPPNIDQPSVLLSNDDQGLAPSSPATEFAVDQASLMYAAGKDIRQQLFDPPVVVPKPPPPKPLPSIELVSTILRDNGEHSAWVRDGQMMRKVIIGDTLGPEDNQVVVQAMEADMLVVIHEGKAVELRRAAASGGRR